MSRTVSVNGAEAAEATSGGSILPEGEYIATIIRVKEGKYASVANKGKPKLEVEYKITESGTGEGVGRKIRDFGVPLFTKWSSGSQAHTFFQFFGALGVEFPEGGEDADIDLPEDDDLYEQSIGLRIKHEPDQKDPDVLWPRIKGYFPADKGVKVAAAKKEDSWAL